MDALEIRVATGSDLGPLIDAFGPGIPAAQIKRRLEESREGYRTMLVAIEGGRVVGVVSVGGGRFQREGSMRLFSLDVGPAFQRKGVGTALINAVEALAEDRGLDEVNLEVEIDNNDAMRLYTRLGYRVCGDVVMDQWKLLRDDGSEETVEKPVFVMVKKLGST